MQACGLLVMVCQVMMDISWCGGNFIIGMLMVIISFISDHLGDTDANIPRQTLNQLPPTIETIVSWFSLDGKIIVCAVCPSCHANYSLDSSSQYPSKCNNQPTPGSICNTPLLNSAGKPLKIVTMHSLKDYLSGLFANTETEGYIMSSWERVKGLVPNSVKAPHNAKFLHNLQGHDGELFYASQDRDGKEEARLTFALCVNFFVIEGMHVCRLTTLLRIIALACLNLPIEICYKLEYIVLFTYNPWSCRAILD